MPHSRITYFKYNRARLSGAAVAILLIVLLSAVLATRGGVRAATADRLVQPSDSTGLGIPIGGERLITDAAAGAHSVYSADFDGDGDLDVVVASRGDGRVRWFENDGDSPPSFQSRTVGELPGAYMAIPVDLNMDGHIDIAAVAVTTVEPSAVLDLPTERAATPDATVPNATDENDGSVIWLENNGESNPDFTMRVIVNDLDYPVSIFAGDLDGDGDPDLMTASRDDNRVRWYRNEGGTPLRFGPSTLTYDALGAVSVQAGDLDGDGDMDIVSASEDDDQISWYRNEGESRPEFVRQIIRRANGVAPDGVDFAKAVFVSDVDLDADLDIVYASENANEIGWYENDGASDPAFLQHVVATNLDHIKSVYAADLDRDGDIDLFSASSSDNRIAWYENDGDANPRFSQHIVTDRALGARGVNVGDLDGDGDLDILAASRSDGRVVWYPNLTIHRNARYTALPETFVATQPASRHAISADVDQDGDQDLLTIGETTVLLHENRGGQPPTFDERVLTDRIQGGRWVETGDLDGDGDLDILAASRNNQTIYWLENRGNGQFSTRTAAQGIVHPRSIVVTDINNNGDLDFAVASDNNNAIFWFANDGASPPSFRAYLVTNLANYARSVFATDLDNDGDQDLLSAAQGTGEVAWYENDGTYWPDFQRHVIVSRREGEHLPDGDGGLWWPDGAQHVFAADLDADGDMDVLSASESDHTIAWYENDGRETPGFRVRFIDRTARGVHAVYADDADNDGDVDVFAAIEYDNEIAWYENDGRRDKTPGFVYHQIYDQALTAHSIHADDVDDDGDIDLLATARSSGMILWFENLGGQYRIQLIRKQTENLVSGRANSLMTVRALHRGRSRNNDADIYLRNIAAIFEDARGRPMTGEQLNALFSRLAVYRDTDKNRSFSPSRDELLAEYSSANIDGDGRVVLDLPAEHPEARLQPGTYKDYFFVGDINGACGDAYPEFRVKLVTNAGGYSAWDNRPLLPEFARNIDGDSTEGEDRSVALQINEFMADNVQTMEDPDEPGEFPDWIEIHNRSDFAVDLSGMYLTDDADNPTRYRIPSGVEIEAHGFIVFIADGEFTQGPLHTNFSLSKDGETVGLFDRDEMGNQLIDIYTFDPVGPDQSIGRPFTEPERWDILGVASPGRLNVEAPLDQFYFLPTIRLQSGC